MIDHITQDIIEGSMEKRSKDKFGPPGGKQLICFVVDLKDKYRTRVIVHARGSSGCGRRCERDGAPVAQPTSDAIGARSVGAVSIVF